MIPREVSRQLVAILVIYTQPQHRERLPQVVLYLSIVIA
jgi:hypothetical protein